MPKLKKKTWCSAKAKKIKQKRRQRNKKKRCRRRRRKNKNKKIRKMKRRKFRFRMDSRAAYFNKDIGKIMNDKHQETAITDETERENIDVKNKSDLGWNTINL